MSSKTHLSGNHDFSRGLYFVPLGGTGQIGMNLYLYAIDGDWFMVDCGIGFADIDQPGVDITLPDIGFLADKKDRLRAIFVTHAHEDHIGALPYLWPELQAPIYLSDFASAFLRLKLRETNFGADVPIKTLPLGQDVKIGSGQFSFIHMTHSIPQAQSLLLQSPYGNVLHSGDWKIDPQPLLDTPSDLDRLEEIGKMGVHTLVCDSTNAMVAGHSGSEEDAYEGLKDVIGQQKNRVIVTCFASNLARLQSIAKIAHAYGRHCALVGRSLWRMHEAAQAAGYLSDLPFKFLSPRDAMALPRDKILLICTGSQGESRAALTRIAQRNHPHIALDAGDTVLFSARDIPGNEQAIARTRGELARQGIEVITSDHAAIHVSGHPARQELSRVFQILQPQNMIPMHGEYMHLEANIALAQSCQIAHTVMPHDGAVIKLDNEVPGIVASIPLTRRGMDGHRLIELDGDIITQRRKISTDGCLFVTLVLDEEGRLDADVEITTIGLVTDSEQDDIESELAEKVEDMIEQQEYTDQEELRHAVYLYLRRYWKGITGKKPAVIIHILA